MVKLKTKKIEVIKQQKRKEKKEKWRKQYADNREENAAKARERMRALRKARKEEKEAEAKAETRALVRISAKQSSAARKKKLQRQREKERTETKRRQTAKRVAKLRERRKNENTVTTTHEESQGFPSRTARKRASDKAKQAMPATPKKKADILEKIAVGSPRTKALLTERGLLKTPEEQKETTALRALAADISEGLSHVKKSGSSEKRAAYTAFKSLAFGKNVKKAKAKRSLSKLVNLPEKTISRAISRREKVLKGDIPSWQYMNRKVRSDALSAEDSKLIYDYWTHQASRPTGDKKDVVKQRISRRQYIHHAKHVLEKTQTEAYMEFRELYPNIKVSQRKFESLKPFFVKQARERDRKSCLCRKHVETQIVFSACMKFRKALLKKNPELESSVSVPKTVTEAATLTLCPKPEGSMFHNIKCLERQCSECGVQVTIAS